MSPDRYGDPDDEAPQQPLHDPRCDGSGWVDREADHPRPCFDCRPHLRPERLHRAVLDADQLRAEPQPTKENPDDA